MPHHRTHPPHPPHHSGHRRHHGERLLHALELLIEVGVVTTTSELAEFARRSDEPDAESVAIFLDRFAAEAIPPGLALEKLRIDSQLVAYRRNNELLRNWKEKIVGLILPLPPPITDAFSALEKSVFLVPGDHPVPPHLRNSIRHFIRGTRSSRQFVSQAEVLVFEGSRQNGNYCVDPDVADVVDLRIIPTTAVLVVHIRPHSHPEDVILPSSGQQLMLM